MTVSMLPKLHLSHNKVTYVVVNSQKEALILLFTVAYKDSK